VIDVDVLNPPRPYTPKDLKTDISPIPLDKNSSNRNFFFEHETVDNLNFTDNIVGYGPALNPPGLKRDSQDRERFSYSKSDFSKTSNDHPEQIERLRIPSFKQPDESIDSPLFIQSSDRVLSKKTNKFGIDLDLIERTYGQQEPPVRNKFTLSQRQSLNKKYPLSLKNEYNNVFKPKLSPSPSSLFINHVDSNPSKIT